jgi:hypothetical protein
MVYCTTKWEDWKPTFLSSQRSIADFDRIPLKYICCDKDEADPTAHNDFLDNVAMAPLLIGDSFARYYGTSPYFFSLLCAW